MSEVKVVRDEQGNAIVIIPDIIFWNKQDIDWDAVKEYLKKYLGEIIENKQTKELNSQMSIRAQSIQNI